MPTKIYASPDPEANALEALDFWQAHQDHAIYHSPRGAFIVLRLEPATHIPQHWAMTSPEAIAHQRLALPPEEEIPCPSPRSRSSK